ncbi:MAG: ABC transporter permease [Chloroflexi bacterium]|nr:ABC transporter permease [Chloroflexota bacterium]
MKSAAWLQMMIMVAQYLKGRKLRTLLTTLAVVFGVGMIFAFNLVLPSAMDAIRHALEGDQEAVDLNITSTTGEAFAPEQPIQAISNLEGVEAVAGILQRKVIFPDNFNAAYDEIEMVGVNPATIRQVNAYELKDGQFLQPEDTGVLVVPNGVAKVGDTFPLLTTNGVQSYQVVGVLKDKPINPDMPRLLTTLSDAQAIVNQPGLINLIQVKYADGANSDRLTAQIEKTLGADFVTNAESDTFASMKIGLAMLNVFAVIALFLGGFLIFNTFRTVVIERRHDLGMLRAIGATRRQIMQLILLESLLQGLIGTFIGLVTGYLLALIMTHYLTGLYSQFAGSITLHLEIRASAFLLAALMGLGVTLLAGYFPARHASRTAPLEALRPTTVAAAHRAARWGLYVGLGLMLVAALLLIVNEAGAPLGAVVFLVGTVIAAPGLVVPAARLLDPILTLWFAREGDIARSNMVRQPGRASITASTLMIGLATLIMIAAMVSGFDAMTEDMLNTSFASDILLMPPAIAVYSNLIGADPSLKQNLMALPEVETVSDWHFASSFHDGSRLYILGIDPTTYPQVTALEFREGNAQDAYAALSSGRNVIINSLTAITFGLRVGDTLALQTAEGAQPYRVVGIANDILNLKLLSMMISQDNMATDFHKTESIFLMINLKPGVDQQVALSKIKTVAQAYPQFKVDLTDNYRKDLLDITTGVVQIFYILAALILIPAALGLLNTLTINMLERTREIGVVRAIGASRTQVQRMVVAEALLLGLFGAAMGVLAGVAMSYGFTTAFSTIGWKVPYIFPIMGIGAALIIAILLAMFSSVLPARNAAKLDIIRALQYE